MEEGKSPINTNSQCVTTLSHLALSASLQVGVGEILPFSVTTLIFDQNLPQWVLSSSPEVMPTSMLFLGTRDMVSVTPLSVIPNQMRIAFNFEK